MHRAATVAMAQSAVGADVVENARQLRAQMSDAAGAGADLVVFPEFALSGSPGEAITDLGTVDWGRLECELARLGEHAKQCGIHVAVGSVSRVESEFRNSVYVIDPSGSVFDRYDKRILSFTESARWFTPGRAPVVLSVQGIRIGIAICIEVRFPELFAAYDALNVDAVMIATNSAFAIDETLAMAQAHFYSMWVGLSHRRTTVPTEPKTVRAMVIGPDGGPVAKANPHEISLAVAELVPADARWEVPIRKARPWRRGVRTDLAARLSGLKQ